MAGNATTRVPGDEPVGGQRVLKIDVGEDDEHGFSPSDARDQPAGTTVQFHFHPTVSTANHNHNPLPMRLEEKVRKGKGR